MLRIFKKAKEYKNRIAVKDNDSSYSYKDLTETSDEVAYSLLSEKADLNEDRIGFLISPSFKYLTVLWGIWKAGGIAVPISISATESELIYYLKAAQIKKLILDKVHLEKFSNLSTKINIHIEDVANLLSKQSKSLPEIKKDGRAMILFTSGTTNKPKGVVSTHGNIEAQIKSLVEAWEWDKNDSIPLILPLHHIHGIINSLSCPLWVGAKVDILGRFEADKVIEKIINNNYSVF
ncbi:MAG: long-chain fatty acid--CoA ligase, partial [Gammaproteobacteria bacterium]